jgi:prostamide/prostaglandin F2alpha synthase
MSATATATSSGAAGAGAGAPAAVAASPSILAHAALPCEDARTGAALVLGDLWSERPVVLSFLRRLGCQMCRVVAQDMDALRTAEAEPLGADVVCLTFERFGEDSDKERAFDKGGFFKGRVVVVPKRLYEELFPRRSVLSNLYGVATKGVAQVLESRRRGVDKTANLVGDGFAMGGTFVVDAQAAGAKVLLEKRQRFFGDDATPEELLAALNSSAGGLKPRQAAIAAAAEPAAAAATAAK